MSFSIIVYLGKQIMPLLFTLSSGNKQFLSSPYSFRQIFESRDDADDLTKI